MASSLKIAMSLSALIGVIYLVNAVSGAFSSCPRPLVNANADFDSLSHLLSIFDEEITNSYSTSEKYSMTIYAASYVGAQNVAEFDHITCLIFYKVENNHADILSRFYGIWLD